MLLLRLAINSLLVLYSVLTIMIVCFHNVYFSYKGEELETKCSCDCVDHRSVRHCLCFNSLVRHVCCLFEHWRKKKDHFENSVRELSKQSHFNVWKDVLRSVKERIG